jgi:transcription initiation factor TFIIIB Brf1 subunit/transcription initiation factor TFIIB
MTGYEKVVLTLSNVLLPPEKLYPNPTPSTSEGLPYDIEYDLRLIGCELIQTACLLLKLPQTAVATGQVLFHRYFYSSSFVRRSMEIVAMACTNLAAKIEENARRIRDVINVFHHIKQVRSGSIIQPLILDQVYIDRKNAVISAERRLLKELGFCVYVKHPHKMITMYLKALEQEREKDLVQTAW